VLIAPMVNDGTLVQNRDQVVVDALHREVLDELGTGRIVCLRGDLDHDQRLLDEHGIPVRHWAALDHDIRQTNRVVVDRYAQSLDENLTGQAGRSHCVV